MILHKYIGFVSGKLSFDEIRTLEKAAAIGTVAWSKAICNFHNDTREDYDYRRLEYPIKGPLKSPILHSNIVLKVLRYLNRASIIADLLHGRRQKMQSEGHGRKDVWQLWPIVKCNYIQCKIGAA